MSQESSELITVVALCQFLLDMLDQLDHEIASEAPIAALRRFSERAQAELERHAQAADGRLHSG